MEFMVVQWVKGLLHKHEDLSFNPQHHINSQAQAVGISHSSGDRGILGTHAPASFGQISKFWD